MSTALFKQYEKANYYFALPYIHNTFDFDTFIKDAERCLSNVPTHLTNVDKCGYY